MEGVQLEIREDALRAIAVKAKERKTGARGLRTIMENMLLDVMYDLPSMENVSKVVVDEAVVKGEAKPFIVYENSEPKRESRSEEHTSELPSLMRSSYAVFCLKN